METGFADFDSHFKLYSDGACFLTGECKEFANTILPFLNNNSSADLHETLMIFGERTQLFLQKSLEYKNLSKRNKTMPSVISSVYKGDDILDDYYNKKDQFHWAFSSSGSKHPIIMTMFDKYSLNDEDVQTGFSLSSTGRKAIILSKGKFGKLSKQYEHNYGHHIDPYRIHAHFEDLGNHDYDVEVISYLPKYRNGRYKIHIDQEKSLYDVMTENVVLDNLYEICMKDKEENEEHEEHGYSLKKLLGRYKQITGKDRPGFMR